MLQLWAHKNIVQADRTGDFQIDFVPNTEVNHARAKVPPVIHAGLNCPYTAGTTHLRLFYGCRLDHNCQDILCLIVKLISDFEHDGREHPGMLAQAFPVQEILCLIIHALKVKLDTFALDLFADDEGLLIKPGALWNPFTEQAVAVYIGIRDFSQLPQIIMGAARDGTGPPVTPVAAARKMRAAPAPVLAVEVFEKPVTTVERYAFTHPATPTGSSPSLLASGRPGCGRS